jgi:hypothetical protein
MQDKELIKELEEELEYWKKEKKRLEELKVYAEEEMLKKEERRFLFWNILSVFIFFGLSALTLLLFYILCLLEK